MPTFSLGRRGQTLKKKRLWCQMKDRKLLYLRGRQHLFLRDGPPNPVTHLHPTWLQTNHK